MTTQSVHAVGGRIFAQLWHVGRVSQTSLQRGGAAPVSASGLVAKGATAFGYGEDGKPGFVQASPPRPLETEEVFRVVADFPLAAANAMEARFDGVEIHRANDYLFEQFTNPLVNDRTGRYSGASIENRLRFTLEVVDAVSARIGSHRVGIRISPYGLLFDVPHYDDIDELYTALAASLAMLDIAYVHVMDQGGFVMGESTGPSFADRFDRPMLQMRRELGTTTLILAGGMTLARAPRLVDDGVIDLAAFGQAYIASSDLVAQLAGNLPLA